MKYNDFIELLRESIKEELGINDEVSHFACLVSDKIYDNNNLTETGYTNDGIKYKTYRFTETLHDAKVGITLRVMFFKNNEAYEHLVTKSPIYTRCDSVSINGKGNTLFVTIPVINGKMKRDEVMECVQHEVNHLYQQITSKLTYNAKDKQHLVSDNSKLYAYAASKLYDKDRIAKSLATIVYLGNKYEIDGFANGAYGKLVSTFPESSVYEPDIVYNTELMIWYEKLKMSLEIIENTDMDNLKKYLNDYKTFKWNYAKFVTKARSSLDYMARSMGRVITKYKEYCTLYGMREHHKPLKENYYI